MTDIKKRTLELISVRKSASTLELCGTLGISESTARRLWVRLSDRGAVYKYHGGGMSVDYLNVLNGIQKRFEQHADEKVTATCAQLDCLVTDNALHSDAVMEFQQARLQVVLV